MNDKQRETVLAWVEALEGPYARQTSLSLSDATGMCCLGVLATVAAFRGDIDVGMFPASASASDASWCMDNNGDEFLPEEVFVELVGNGLIPGNDQTRLSSMNDEGGKTFPQIAAYIRERAGLPPKF